MPDYEEDKTVDLDRLLSQYTTQVPLKHPNKATEALIEAQETLEQLTITTLRAANVVQSVNEVIKSIIDSMVETQDRVKEEWG